MFYVKSKLSALIDRGRWYFPNQWTAEYGIHKEPAYRGIRQPVLNHVVNAYDAITELDDDNRDDVRKRLTHIQREFVSCIQVLLDPRKRQDEIAKIYEYFAVSEQLRNLKDVERDRR